MHDLFSELYFQLITRLKAQEKKVDHLEHAKRKEEHGMKWLKEQEEERQRRRDEELKRQREEKECLEQERKEAEEEEYRKKKELLDAQAKRQQEREKEMEERQRERDGNYPILFVSFVSFPRKECFESTLFAEHFCSVSLQGFNFVR